MQFKWNTVERTDTGPMRVTSLLCIGLSVACALYISSTSAETIADPLMSVPGPGTAVVNVVTQHNNNARTGANLQETILTGTGPNAINNANFGELWKLPVDGQINAQPLYVGQYNTVSNQSERKNILIVATMNNSVYAFDADSGNPAPLWSKTKFDPPLVSNWWTGGNLNEEDMGMPNNKPTGQNVATDGIMSTPVIDRTRNVGKAQPGVIYFVEMYDTGGNIANFKLYEISLFDGSTINTRDLGALGLSGFYANHILNRPGLLLSNNNVYVAFGSRVEDTVPYHGWVLSFDAGNLAISGSFRTTNAPDLGGTYGGGIWQAGNGLAADGSGNVYFTTGNGFYNANLDNPPQYYGYCKTGQLRTAYDPNIPVNCCDAGFGGCACPISTQRGGPGTSPVSQEDSIVKLTPGLQFVGQYYPGGTTDPIGQYGKDFQTLEACDADFGSSGPMLFSQGATTRLVVGGKTGQMFVLDPAQMTGSKGIDGQLPMTQGAFQATLNAYVSAHECYDKGFVLGPHIHGGPVFYHGTGGDYLFVWAEKDEPRRFQIASGVVGASPTNSSIYSSTLTDGKPPNGMPGGGLSISANVTDSSTAILWALIPSKGSCGTNVHCDVAPQASDSIVAGDLLAFRVSDMALLWGTRNFHGNPATTISAASNGQMMPRATINVTVGSPLSALGFPSSGVIRVITRAGAQIVSYTGITSSSFTGCTGGTGVMSTGGQVMLLPDLRGGTGSSRILRDYTKYVAPTVANGKVFVATSGFNVTVYGKRTLSTTTGVTSSLVTCTDDEFYGDVDGDGASDLICHHRHSSGIIDVTYSLNNQTAFRPRWSSGFAWCREGTRTLLVGDFDGDGRADLLCHAGASDNSPGEDFIAFATNGGIYTGASRTNAIGDCWCDQSSSELLTGDFDGDGRADLLCHDRKAGTIAIRTSQAVITDVRKTNPSWFPFTNAASHTFNLAWCTEDDDQLLVGDIDGDGLDDLLCHRTSDGYIWIAYNKTNRQNGTVSFTGSDWSNALSWCFGGMESHLLLKDVDGDGAADLFCHNTNTGQSWMASSLRPTDHVSDPYRRQPNTTTWTRPGPFPSNGWCYNSTATPKPTVALSDIDGDNRAELICHTTNPSPSSGPEDYFAYYPYVGIPPH